MGAEDFTDTVNFRCLASELRKQNYTEVPDHAVLSDICAKLHIAPWQEHLEKTCGGNFTAMLAFHLMDVGEPTH